MDNVIYFKWIKYVNMNFIQLTAFGVALYLLNRKEKPKNSGGFGD